LNLHFPWMWLPNWTGAFFSVGFSGQIDVAISEGIVISNQSIVECALLDFTYPAQFRLTLLVYY